MSGKAKAKTAGTRPRKKATSATTRSTAGPGYQFEDLVAARLLVKMLLGRPLPGIGTGGGTLQFQVDPLGWRIDDLLVSASGGTPVGRLALSCKSSHQVTGKGLPSDFVTRAWAQWRDTASGPMNRETDTLGLVTRGQPNAFQALWSDIVQWCGAGDAAVAVARIRKSAKHAAIFDSVRAPADGLAATDLETVSLIRRLLIEPLDFQLEPSQDREDGIAWCRELLASDSGPKAEALWTEIVRLAADTRVVGGTILLEALWAHLRPRFPLKARPDFATAWQSLTALTDEYKASISTQLPSGHVISRDRETEAFNAHLREHPFSLVFGDSGSGKSAFVKHALEDQAAHQVWLGPDQVAAATSALDRSKLHLMHPLEAVLAASPAASNILVIDAAEKLTPEVLIRLRDLLDALIPTGPNAPDTAWKVVIITQTDGWAERAVALLGQRVVTPLSIGLLDDSQVRGALLSTQNLRWLASDVPSVGALRNLKMLGWIMGAETALAFTQADLTSPPAISDRLWSLWTQGRADAQRLLMVLGEREANFERSFPLSGLTTGDIAAFDNASEHLPLRLNSRNSLIFEHDLAADWSRFQWLKQAADDSSQWAALSQNPLWNGALRLLGQFLLREPLGTGTAWDAALAAAEARDDQSTTDILLEALCLDPDAHRLLTERADHLLAESGKLLQRLLLRFLHVATTPRFAAGAFQVDAGLALYLEASIRHPIVGRWPPVARFLHDWLTDLEALALPVVSKVCEVWLTSTPFRLGNDVAMPFRREFAELALANARTVQVQKATGALYLRDGWDPLYSAAFAAAEDLAGVRDWILEQVNRRALSPETAGRIAAIRSQQQEERAERLRSDAAYAAEESARTERLASMPRSFRTSRRRPPWPLGPRDKIDHNFHKVALGASALVPLMKADPALAAEALLALLIEGRPEEDFSDHPLHDSLGLEYEHSAYPTAFWKSPFFHFLQIAPDQALTTLIQLVEFCTERWAASRSGRGQAELPTIGLRMAEGEKAFLGDGRVFDWAHEEDAGQGQLYCALNALERWLTQELEAGHDIEPALSRLLQDTGSAAFLGVLVNVAKFRPELLEGSLRPLLSAEESYCYDFARVRDRRFTAWAWVREGDAIYTHAQAWALAKYRQRLLGDLATELVRRSPSASDYVQDSIATWPDYDRDKDIIESGILRASLNPANYLTREDAETGQPVDELVYPAALARQIEAFEAEHAPRRQTLMLPQRLEDILRQSGVLATEGAEYLATLLAPAAPGDDDAGLLQVAAAAALVVCAPQWLAGETTTQTQVQAILREAAAGVGDTAEDISNERVGLGRDALKFAAFGLTHLWIHEGAAGGWDAPLLQVLTSGNREAVRVIGALGHHNRATLGSRWPRLLQIGLLWSALSMLSPDCGDSDRTSQRWSRWLGWLRARSLTNARATISALDPVRIWGLIGKVAQTRWRNQAVRRSRTWSQDEARIIGLQTDFLDGLFAWLVGEAASSETPDTDHRALLLRFWDYEQQWCALGRNNRDEYRLPYAFGYHVIEAMARVAATDPAPDASDSWREILRLGSDAHILIDHFLGAFLLHRGQAPDLFVERWTAMIQFALSSDWTTGGHWFYGQQMLRRLMGFGLEASLAALPNPSDMIVSMRPLYEHWARAHVTADEANIAAFAHFLATSLGAPLRIDGLKWISETVVSKQRPVRWRDDGAGDAMVGLLDTTLTQNATDISRDSAARTALVGLAADLAASHVAAALALQERIRGLR